MRSINLPSRNGSKEVTCSIGLMWENNQKQWIAVISVMFGRCVCGWGKSEKEALCSAVDHLFAPNVGYNPNSYNHNAVYDAYLSAPEMPKSPIVSVNV